MDKNTRADEELPLARRQRHLPLLWAVRRVQAAELAQQLRQANCCERVAHRFLVQLLIGIRQQRVQKLLEKACAQPVSERGQLRDDEEDGRSSEACWSIPQWRDAHKLGRILADRWRVALTHWPEATYGPKKGSFPHTRRAAHEYGTAGMHLKADVVEQHPTLLWHADTKSTALEQRPVPTLSRTLRADLLAAPPSTAPTLLL
eukprot:40185-Prymnesium_polylepis.1